MQNQQEIEWHRSAMSKPEVRRVIEHWRAGEQVTDEQYLMLREGIDRAPADEADVCGYVLVQFLRPHYQRVFQDAVFYYDMRRSEKQALSWAAHNSVKGGIVVANDYMVRGDTSVRVPSHFERIVLECAKHFLWGLTGQELRQLPRDQHQFKSAVEREWREVLQYGNAFYGFTVVPRIGILDMVRYQQLGGGCKRRWKSAVGGGRKARHRLHV